MRQALNIHPEWNGDWVMPDSIKKAEIDYRDGRILREIDNKEAELIEAQQKVLKKNQESKPKDDESDINIIDSFLNQVPLEFRRIELFITGTIPVSIPKIEDENPNDIEPETQSRPWTPKKPKENKEGNSKQQRQHC